MSVITPKDCFHQPQVADLRLIACPGAEELTNLCLLYTSDAADD